jgi:hypothetical protein
VVEVVAEAEVVAQVQVVEAQAQVRFLPYPLG